MLKRYQVPDNQRRAASSCFLQSFLEGPLFHIGALLKLYSLYSAGKKEFNIVKENQHVNNIRIKFLHIKEDASI
jgi:hypothetical protein